MAGSDYSVDFASNSRIADDASNWEAACDTDVPNWETTDKFVICIYVNADVHNGSTETLKLQWQDDDDPSPAYVDLASTGELKWGTCTDPGDCECQGSGVLNHYFIDNANSVEVVTNDDNRFAEMRIVIDPAGAETGHTYSFQLYSVTESAVCGGTVQVQITISEELPSDYTTFKTPQYSGSTHHVALDWTWNSGYCFK